MKMNRRNLLKAGTVLGAAMMLPAVRAEQKADDAPVNKDDLLSMTGPGGKFDFDGQALHFAGNSVISHVPQNTEFYANLVQFQQQIAHSKIGDRHVFLPKNSFHMTIFNGTNETLSQRDKPGFWPANLAKDVDITEVHYHYLQKLRQFKPHLPKVLKFRPTELRSPFDKTGITLNFELINKDDEAAIIELRRQLGELFQTTRNKPEELKFHVSLGYTWKKYSAELMEWAEQQRVIWSQEFAKNNPQLELTQLEFAVFDDMLSYSPLWIYKL